MNENQYNHINHIDAVELTRQMICIDSTNPGGQEQKMESFLRSLVHTWNMECIRVRSSEAMPGRRNLLLEIPGDSSLPELVMLCHMDTVPVGRNWTEDPFGAREQNGRIYGRGACDMKSGFACALTAFERAARRCADNNEKPLRTIRLIGTVDEEGEMHGAEQVIRDGWANGQSLLLDTEPTSLEIQNAHKGRIWFRIEAEGISAHASTPWKGADAIHAMAEVISHLSSSISRLDAHETLGKPTIAFGRIEGGDQPYIVSDHCTLYLDMRLVPPYDLAFAEKLVSRAAERAKEVVPGAKITWTVTGDKVSIAPQEDSLLLAALKESVERAAGIPAKVCAFNGYTDTAVIAGKLGNRDCMSFGPGNLECAHKPDEFVPVEQIRTCEAVLTDLIQSLCFS